MRPRETSVRRSLRAPASAGLVRRFRGGSHSQGSRPGCDSETAGRAGGVESLPNVSVKTRAAAATATARARQPVAKSEKKDGDRSGERKKRKQGDPGKCSRGTPHHAALRQRSNAASTTKRRGNHAKIVLHAAILEAREEVRLRQQRGSPRRSQRSRRAYRGMRPLCQVRSPRTDRLHCTVPYPTVQPGRKNCGAAGGKDDRPLVKFIDVKPMLKYAKNWPGDMFERVRISRAE